MGMAGVYQKYGQRSVLLAQKKFEVEVFVNGKTIGRGHGRSRS